MIKMSTPPRMTKNVIAKDLYTSCNYAEHGSNSFVKQLINTSKVCHKILHVQPLFLVIKWLSLTLCYIVVTTEKSYRKKQFSTFQSTLFEINFYKYFMFSYILLYVYFLYIFMYYFKKNLTVGHAKKLQAVGWLPLVLVCW